MILGIQVGMLIMGLIALIRGSFSISKGKKLRGDKARIVGFVCMLPLPMAFGLGVIVGITSPETLQESPGTILALEVASILVPLAATLILAASMYKSQEAEDRLARRDRWADELASPTEEAPSDPISPPPLPPQPAPRDQRP